MSDSVPNTTSTTYLPPGSPLLSLCVHCVHIESRNIGVLRGGPHEGLTSGVPSGVWLT